MSLSLRERILLRGLGESVLRSDTRLAEMLDMFGCLSSAEPMPAQEQLPSPAARLRAALAPLIVPVTWGLARCTSYSRWRSRRRADRMSPAGWPVP